MFKCRDKKTEKCLVNELTKTGATANMCNVIKNMSNTNIKEQLHVIYHNCQYLELSLCLFFF